jgi:molecular chaperone GrpE
MTTEPKPETAPETDPADGLMPPEDLSDQNPAAPEMAETDRVATLEAELVRMKDHMLRALAETENIRKRAQKEREDATKFAVSSFARDMLEIADNFRRALDAIPAEAREDSPLMKTTIEGIEATERVMLKLFEKHGIRKLEPLGEPFDPNFHEVMFEAPVPGKPAGTIIQLVDPGYVLNDRLLRPARVGIAKADPGDGGSPHRVDETA